MFNVLLDELPEEWNGYMIDSDFQTGIMISQCMSDNTLSESEKFFTAVDLLFPGSKPPLEQCEEAITWFLTEFNHDHYSQSKNKSVPVMDFDMDQWRIYSAFLNQYRIDLNKERMHWFVFMGLLRNLGECSFVNVMEIRGKKITRDMSKTEKDHLTELKKTYKIDTVADENPHSLEEQKAINEFLKYVNKGAIQ